MVNCKTQKLNTVVLTGGPSSCRKWNNRFRICEKYGLPFQMLVFSFADLLEAKQWALNTQKGRRNLDKWELGKIALKLRPEIEARARANQGTRTDLSATLPKSSPPVDTRRELAQAVGLGERTMGKVMQIDEHAPAAIREALCGQMKLRIRPKMRRSCLRCLLPSQEY